MALAEIVPWRWGGLRRWEREERPFEGFRREMESLHRDMDRLFEGMWSEGIGSSSLPDLWARGEIMPQLDVTEDDKAFQVKIDLPGLDEKDVNVTLSDRVLTIRGEKKEEKETKEKDYYRRERAHGTFRRNIEIPAAVDTTKIDASFKKGVLTIQLPKTKEAQEKVTQIEVKAA
ncbi:MAG TPA: Hsp20/alpha crystallin family protein [Gammaproteobacteria bacterium]|jgi:HSP20 family protein|nr:Hsp20/alpha crystallin family protein [Gammaproteobacteria bacterium]